MVAVQKIENKNMSFEILAYEPTSLGILCLRRRSLLSQPETQVTEVTLNHEFLMSSHLTESERALTSLGLDFVYNNTESNSLRILVGGLGLGYTAFESLQSDRVTHVEVVEFLQPVIGWLRDGLIPLAESLNGDQRLEVSHDDVYRRMGAPLDRSTQQPFDLIAIDVDHSPADVLGDQSQAFYSVEGLTNARTHLTAAGVIGIWSYAEDTPLLDNMKQVFSQVDVERITVWNDLIREEQTDWLFFGQG